MDLNELRRIIQQETPVRLEVGTVTSADPRGTRSVTVRLSGGHVCSRVNTCVDGLQVGDQVLVARMMQLNRVVVIGQLLSDANPMLARRGILAPPDNLTVVPVPAALVVRWDTYPGEDICWQVRYNTSASDTGATDELVTRGSYYTHYIVDGSGDMATAATYHFKVRALRWLGDNNVMYSAWSTWGSATSGGHNLREIVELELQNATELTIDAGVVTRTQTYHAIDTQGDDPTDDLATVNGGTEGDLLVLRPANDAHTVVVKHNIGNVWLSGKADVTLDDLNDHIALVCSTAGYWCDIGGGAGGGGGGATTFLQLTDTPGDYTDQAGRMPVVNDAESALQFIAAAGWLSVGDISDLELKWQPDCLAVLRAGVITGYPDPDAAFVAADTAGDVILVPPDTWTLSAGHVLPAGVSVYGLGPATDCVLSYEDEAPGAIVLSAGSGEIANVTLQRTNTYEGAGTVVGLALNTGTRAKNVIANVVNEDTAVLAGVDAIQVTTGPATLIDCRCYADNYGQNMSAGISLLATATVESCYAYGYSRVSGKYSAGIYTGESSVILRTDAIGGNADDDALAYGIYAYGDSTVMHGSATGGDYDIHVDDTFSLSLYSVQHGGKGRLEGANFIHLPGDRTGSGLAETITGSWTFDQPITIAETKFAPEGPGAGYGRLYCKDVSGQTRFVLQDDNAKLWMVAGVAQDITVTVKAAGGDFATPAAAVDYFKDWLVMGNCVIECDADTYTNTVDFSSVVIGAGATLTLRGDTRVLAGITYVDSAPANRAELADGGVGDCQLTTNPGLTQITVTCATTNPNFTGWVNGDKILVLDNAGNAYERTINQVSPGGAGNHVIEVTVALGAALGNRGTAFCLLPDRILAPAGIGVEVTGVKGVVLDGWYLAPSSSDFSLFVSGGGITTCQNVVCKTADYGFYADGMYSFIHAADGACSAWECSRGYHGQVATFINAMYSVAVKCGYGYAPWINSSMQAHAAIATKCTYGLIVSRFSMLFAPYIVVYGSTYGTYVNGMSYTYLYQGAACDCVLGYYCIEKSLLWAQATGQFNDNNTTNYNPWKGSYGWSTTGDAGGNADLYATEA